MITPTCCARPAPTIEDRTIVDERDVDTLSLMTQNFDDDAARNRLQSEQERVEGLIKNLRDEGLDQEEADQVGDLSHVPLHQGDQGSDLFEREKDLAILEQLENELAEIEAALQRLDQGTYGIDEVTGEPIAPERLEARPSARTNVDTPDADSV
jgi:RNA polymerase-binding transcription factor DksA